MDVFAVLRIGADFIAWQNHEFVRFVEAVGDFAERVHAIGDGAVLFRALFGSVVGIGVGETLDKSFGGRPFDCVDPAVEIDLSGVVVGQIDEIPANVFEE